MTGEKYFLGLAILIMLILAIAIGGGCSMFGSESLAAPVEELDQRLIDANNGLGFDLYLQLADQDPDRNIFISPSSIITALAMAYNGAEGETRIAMEEALRLKGMTVDEVNSAFADLLTILQNPDPNVELAVANSLWAREGVSFDEGFINRSRDYYGAELTELNFDDPGSADTINSWVKEKTRNKIDGIVEPPINPETILFLINAIYFKGEWSEPFDLELTSEGNFNLPGGGTKESQFMFRNDDFNYLESDLFQAVRLPYGKNERVGMYLFLPAESASLEEFQAELNRENWENWISSFRSMEGNLSLPRFSFEYETSLKKTLETLGMGIAFKEGAADFSGMRPTPPDLFINEVKHKTFVEVNEKGTEAAAVTSIEVGTTAMPEIFNMVLDRPFFFAIADDMTETILFMGSVSEP
jgi:serine protease inhibitor